MQVLACSLCWCVQVFSICSFCPKSELNIHILNKYCQYNSFIFELAPSFWGWGGEGFGIPIVVVLVKYTAYCLTWHDNAWPFLTLQQQTPDSTHVIYIESCICKKELKKKKYFVLFSWEQKSFFFFFKKRAASNLFHRRWHIYRTTLRVGDRCSTVVKALCYKSEGRWFDSSWRHWNFSLT